MAPPEAEALRRGLLAALLVLGGGIAWIDVVSGGLLPLGALPGPPTA